MTASKIHQEIRKIYPDVTIWSMAFKGKGKKAHEVWLINVGKPTSKKVLGEGTTAKKAWVAAYEKVQEELKEKK